LIETNKSEWEILSSSEIIKHLTNRGFKNIATFRQDVSGGLYCKNNNKTYVSLDNAIGEKFQLDNSKNIIRFAELMGRFHNCAEGFKKPVGIRVKTEWGKVIERYTTLARRIERYSGVICDVGENNRFEKEVLRYINPLMNRVNASTKVFKSKDYFKALERSMQLKEIGLNSISDNTVVISNEGIKIIDILNLSYNMALEDLSALIKKGLENNRDLAIYEEVLSSYEGVRKLDENSKIVIDAIVKFPFKTLKVINRNIDKKSDDEVLLERFYKYYEREMGIWN
jgi:CotS family spore coat protein